VVQTQQNTLLIIFYAVTLSTISYIHTTEQPLKSADISLEYCIHLHLISLQLMWQQLQVLYCALHIDTWKYVAVPTIQQTV